MNDEKNSLDKEILGEEYRLGKEYYAKILKVAKMEKEKKYK